MDAQRTSASSAPRPRPARPVRTAWPLAAGTAIQPRLTWLAILFALLPLGQVRWLKTDPQGFFRASRPFAAAFPVAVAAWIAWSIAGRAVLRQVGERRRRAHGGGTWWRDMAWPANGVERRIAPGVRGPSVPVAIAVVTTFAVVAAALAGAWRLGGMYTQRPEDWGWTPTSALVEVAAWALPLAWLLVALVPRLGRGRLVVSWPTFPQFSGGRCSFHVGTSPGGARIDGVRVFLRCIRVRNRPFLPLATWNSRLAWVAEARFPLGAYAGPESHLRVEFDVPADAPSTDLHAADAVRWELLILGTVGATDYADCVDVPVYAAAR